MSGGTLADRVRHMLRDYQERAASCQRLAARAETEERGVRYAEQAAGWRRAARDLAAVLAASGESVATEAADPAEHRYIGWPRTGTLHLVKRSSGDTYPTEWVSTYCGLHGASTGATLYTTPMPPPSARLCRTCVRASAS